MTIEPGKAPATQPGDGAGSVATSVWLVQWPMMAFTFWWDAAFDAWQPKPCPHHAAGVCGDLAVPDPIEREGEHALFA